MTRAVVDANVPIVANGRDGNYRLSCQAACVDAIERLIKQGVTLLDDGGMILSEYSRHLHFRGQPGVGDAFFRFVIQNQANRRRVRTVTLALRENSNDYLDFPEDPRLAKFDRGDRMYAACARKSQRPVLNAVDSDWLDHKIVLEENGIIVHFLCGEVKSSWFVVAPATARKSPPKRRHRRKRRT